MKNFKQSDTKRWLFTFSLALAVIVVYKSFGSLSEVFSWIGKFLGILVPFVAAFAIAYFLNRPVSFFERQFKKITNPRLKLFNKRARTISITIVYIIFIGALVLLCYAIIPELISGIVNLWNNAENYFDTAEAFLVDFTSKYPMFDSFDLSEQILSWAEELIRSIDINTIAGTIQSVTGVGSTVVNIILSIFVSIYMLSEKNALIAALRRICSLFMPERALNATARYLHRTDELVYTYFVAQFLDCVIVSIFATIALVLLGAPSPMVLGFIFGMMNIIPYFGPIIGGVVVIFIILVTRGFGLAFWSTVILLALQQIDANIINPRILGDSLDMSPFWVIFAITVGGGLFGFAGMLLGVPAVAVIRLLYRDLLHKRRERQEHSADAQQVSEELTETQVDE